MVKADKEEEQQIVTFKLGEEEFGVDVHEVKEIIHMEQITKIPNTQEYIRGVINLRGGIIVVVDLAKKLGLPVKETSRTSRIIVIEVDKSNVGMIVDSATEVLRLNSKYVKPAPEVITKRIDGNYIEGVGVIEDRLLILLDLGNVLGVKEIKHVAKIHESAPKVPAQAETEKSEKPVEAPVKPPVKDAPPPKAAPPKDTPSPKDTPPPKDSTVPQTNSK